MLVSPLHVDGLGQCAEVFAANVHMAVSSWSIFFFSLVYDFQFLNCVSEEVPLETYLQAMVQSLPTQKRIIERQAKLWVRSADANLKRLLFAVCL